MENRFTLLSLIFTISIISLFSVSENAFAENVEIIIPQGAQSQTCADNLNACYNPDTIIVNQGDVVTWTNLAGNPTHTATSTLNLSWPDSRPIPSGVFDTGNLGGGDSSAPILMDQVGTFDYFCIIHPWQIGSITVQPTSSSDAIPPQVSGSTLNIVDGGTTIQTGTDQYEESCIATDETDPENPACTVQFGDIDTSVLGFQSVVYQATDVAGNVGTDTVSTTVEAALVADHSISIPQDSSLPGSEGPTDCTSQPDACYNPESLVVTQGEIVEWTNDDGVPEGHTATSDDGFWDSGILLPGESFQLDTSSLSPDVYPYHCIVHPWQVGTFVITDPINLDPIPQEIQYGDIVVDVQTFVSDLISPVHLTHNFDGSGDVYIVDQPGIIYRADDSGTLQATPFLDIASKVHMPGFFGTQNENDFDERGLLGLAFNPSYNIPGSLGEGILYTFHSEAFPGTGIADFPITMSGTPDNIGVITEWRVDPTTLGTETILVDPNSERRLLTVEEPQFNHAGGMLLMYDEFELFASFGDGGGANDNEDGHTPGIGNSQDESNLLGSIIRINPFPSCPGLDSTISSNGQYCIPSDNPNVGISDELDEIFANGLRNAWRIAFDVNTQTMIAADVGQNQIEEINIIVNGGNYGWNEREGTFGFLDEFALLQNSPTPSGMIDPVGQYDHDEGISVTGGYVYRGNAIPELYGQYVFGDFSTGFFNPEGRLFYSNHDSSMLNDIKELQLANGNPPLGLFVKSFGEDQNGELYVLAGTNLGPFTTSTGQKLGQVLKIVPEGGIVDPPSDILAQILLDIQSLFEQVLGHDEQITHLTDRIDSLESRIAELEASSGGSTENHIDVLISDIQMLVDENMISSKDAKKLIKELEDVEKKLDKEQKKVCKEIKDYVKDVEKLIKKDKLSEIEGQQLIDNAGTILTSCSI